MSIEEDFLPAVGLRLQTLRKRKPHLRVCTHWWVFHKHASLTPEDSHFSLAWTIWARDLTVSHGSEAHDNTVRVSTIHTVWCLWFHSLTPLPTKLPGFICESFTIQFILFKKAGGRCLLFSTLASPPFLLPLFSGDWHQDGLSEFPLPSGVACFGPMRQPAWGTEVEEHEKTVLSFFSPVPLGRVSLEDQVALQESTFDTSRHFWKAPCEFWYLRSPFLP